MGSGCSDHRMASAERTSRSTMIATRRGGCICRASKTDDEPPWLVTAAAIGRCSIAAERSRIRRTARRIAESRGACGARVDAACKHCQPSNAIAPRPCRSATDGGRTARLRSGRRRATPTARPAVSRPTRGGPPTAKATRTRVPVCGRADRANARVRYLSRCGERRGG